jgi:hypothetical protein
VLKVEAGFSPTPDDDVVMGVVFSVANQCFCVESASQQRMKEAEKAKKTREGWIDLSKSKYEARCWMASSEQQSVELELGRR